MYYIKSYHEQLLEVLASEDAKKQTKFSLFITDPESGNTSEELEIVINANESIMFYFDVSIVEDQPEEPQTHDYPGCPAGYSYEIYDVEVYYVRDNSIETLLDYNQSFNESVEAFLENKLIFDH